MHRLIRAAAVLNLSHKSLYVFERNETTRVVGFVRANSHKSRHKSPASSSAVRMLSKVLSNAPTICCKRVFGNFDTKVAPRWRSLASPWLELLELEDEEELELDAEAGRGQGGCIITYMGCGALRTVRRFLAFLCRPIADFHEIEPKRRRLHDADYFSKTCCVVSLRRVLPCWCDLVWMLSLLPATCLCFLYTVFWMLPFVPATSCSRVPHSPRLAPSAQGQTHKILWIILLSMTVAIKERKAAPPGETFSVVPRGIPLRLELPPRVTRQTLVAPALFPPSLLRRQFFVQALGVVAGFLGLRLLMLHAEAGAGSLRAGHTGGLAPGT
jgi:hypothetical protein